MAVKEEGTDLGLPNKASKYPTASERPPGGKKGSAVNPSADADQAQAEGTDPGLRSDAFAWDTDSDSESDETYGLGLDSPEPASDSEPGTTGADSSTDPSTDPKCKPTLGPEMEAAAKAAVAAELEGGTTSGSSLLLTAADAIGTFVQDEFAFVECLALVKERLINVDGVEDDFDDVLGQWSECKTPPPDDECSQAGESSSDCGEDGATSDGTEHGLLGSPEEASDGTESGLLDGTDAVCGLVDAVGTETTGHGTQALPCTEVQLTKTGGNDIALSGDGKCVASTCRADRPPQDDEADVDNGEQMYVFCITEAAPGYGYFLAGQHMKNLRDFDSLESQGRLKTLAKKEVKQKMAACLKIPVSKVKLGAFENGDIRWIGVGDSIKLRPGTVEDPVKRTWLVATPANTPL